MKYNITGILLICIIAAATLSSSHASYAAGTSEATLIIYKIDCANGAGRTKSSYVAGTINLRLGEDAILPARAEEYMSSCNKAVFESRSIAGRLDQDTLRERLMTNFNIINLYKPETWKYIKEKCNSNDVELEYTPFKPWMIFFIALSLETKKIPSFSIITNLYKLAKEKKKPLSYLESDDSFLYDRIPLEIQIRHVDKLAADAKSITDHLKNIYEIYTRGDMDELAKMSRYNSTDRRDAKMELLWNNVTIDGRIDLMMPLVEKHLSEGGAFIALSAELLPGEKGMLARLRKNGYSITDVSIIKKGANNTGAQNKK